MIKIIVNNIPPYKQSPATQKERKIQKIRKEILINKVKDKMVDKEIITGNVKLIIKYKRSKCRSDSANIIGGICDTLNKIVYNDDFQIKKIDYQEEKSNEDEFELEVISL